MDYDLYHDESLEAGYWHGMLLVPRARRGELLALLARIRANTGCDEPMALKGLTKTTGRRYRCIRSWLHLGVAALLQNLKGNRFPFYTGIDTPHPEFDHLTSPIGARFILFRVREGHATLSASMTHSQKVETTFRMGLKGGLHLFSTTGASLHVASFHFDGHQHYRRHVDVDRIVGRIGSLREGVTIAEDIDIDDRTGDHRRAAECQGFDDCQLLQLTDLIVGGFRTVLGRSTSEAQKRVAAPLKELSDKWHAGPARMANSRWHGGFSVSECFLENNEWRFADIQPEPDTSQLRIDGI